MSGTLEHRIEQFHDLILKPDIENWDAKNRAILQLIELFKQYENESQTVISEVFTTECFRLLKEPVKLLVSQKVFSFSLTPSHLFSSFFRSLTSDHNKYVIFVNY